MSASSAALPETARKAVALALQRLQEPGKAAAVATTMGVSDSTVSRIKTERMEEVLHFLACLGLKVVPAEFKCVDANAYAFLTAVHMRVMQAAPQLIWEADA